MFAKIDFFEKHSVGRIVNRVSNDTYEIDTELTDYLNNFI